MAKKKERIFPSGFCIVIDTREQKRLLKKPPKNLMTMTAALKTGDYSIVGFENLIAVERKSRSDFYGSITAGRKRFDANLQRMSKMEWRALLIEGTERKLLDPSESYSKISPQCIYGSLVSISVRYGIQIYYAERPEDADRWLIEHFLKWYRIKRGG